MCIPRLDGWSSHPQTTTCGKLSKDVASAGDHFQLDPRRDWGMRNTQIGLPWRQRILAFCTPKLVIDHRPWTRQVTPALKCPCTCQLASSIYHIHVQTQYRSSGSGHLMSAAQWPSVQMLKQAHPGLILSKVAALSMPASSHTQSSSLLHGANNPPKGSVLCRVLPKC